MELRRSHAYSILFAGVFLFGLGGNAQARQGHIDVRGAAVEAFCRLDIGEKTTQKTAAGLVTCERSREALSCESARDFESVDFQIAGGCRNLQLRFNAAQRRGIVANGRTRLDVSWIYIATDGQVSRYAARSLPASDVTFVKVSPSQGRLLQFSAPGLSPITIESMLMFEQGTVLPAPSRGGEFVALVAQARVQPIGFRLIGPRQIDIESRNRPVVTAQGLEAGAYSAVPLYQGGLTGDPIRFSVADEQSTFVWVKPGDVGELQVSVPPDSCDRDLEVRVVNTRTGQGGNSIIETEVARIPSYGSCSWNVGGLRPGQYHAQIIDPDGRNRGRSVDVSVQTQLVAKTTINAPRVRVSGVAQLNKVPLAGAVVEFARENSLLPGMTATTASDGRFTIDLETSGRYFATLSHPATARQTKNVALGLGSNAVDWELSGGSLTITIEDALGNQPLTVNIDSRRTSSADTIEQGLRTPTVVTKQGLAFDTYHISAAQEGGRISDVKAITISPAKPHADVILVLRPTSSTLFVTDQAGKPISGAAVLPLYPSNPFIVARPRLAEREAGVFDLEGISAGTHLLIRAEGFAAGCRVIPASGLLRMELEPGRTVSFQLPQQVSFNMIRAFLIEGILNSDCAIPLTQFRPAFDPSSGSVNISNFTSVERLVFRNTGVAYNAFVPSLGQLQMERR